MERLFPTPIGPILCQVVSRLKVSRSTSSPPLRMSRALKLELLSELRLTPGRLDATVRCPDPASGTRPRSCGRAAIGRVGAVSDGVGLWLTRDGVALVRETYVHI